MIEEDYVTFEQAKLLKEKGFPAEIIHIGGLEEFPCMYIAPPKDHKGLWANDTGIKIPTLSLAQKWFRKEKDIHIAPECDVEVDSYGNTKGSCYDLKMIVFDFKNEESHTIYLSKTYKTYEEALSDGINAALKLV